MRKFSLRAVPSGVFPIKLLGPDEASKEEAAGGLSLPVDLIRVVGIFLVVLLHVTNTFNDQIYKAEFNAGSWWTFTVFKSLSLACVPLFIILSGALLLQPSKLNEPIRVFLRKRVNRIGLAFGFWTGVYLIWAFYVTKTAVTLSNVGQAVIISLLTGAYYHFWFLYVIIGLYLLTPVLRVIVSNCSINLVRYMIVLWFVGVAVVPLLPLFTSYNLYEQIFLLGGYIGYFLLGFYLQAIRLGNRFLYVFLVVGLALTVALTWVMTFPLGGLRQEYYFFDFLSVGVVLGSVALYNLLSKFPSDWPGKKHPCIGKIAGLISQNTLPIYLFHVMVIEALAIGALGFTVNLSVAPIVEIPLVSVVVLFVTLGLILLMKRVPVLRKLIG